MPKPIIVTFEGTESTLGYARLDRKKLYATRKRLPLDGDGNPCKKAELSDDGAMLIMTGMTGQGYFDEDDTWIATKDLVGLDADGKEVPLQPSTLGTAQTLAEVGPEALLDAAISGVYLLDPQDVSAELGKALESGKLFRFDFNARADYHMETAYLLANAQGLFMLLGDTHPPPWCELDQPVVVLEEDDDDELDFEMF